tara:strand:+ start:2080 stop:2376 length:297 start_codon:yes stop_codon:yes gene_type:complete
MFFSFGYLLSNELNFTKKIISESFPTESGIYLSWIIAEKNGSHKEAFDLVSEIKLSLSENETLKKAFFLSLNHGTWDSTVYFAKKIQNLDSDFFFFLN